MAGSSTSEQLCPDWVFSNNSNVHSCKNRAWFTEYTPFNSVAGSLYSSNDTVAVAGIGTVLLPVKKGPNRTGPDAHGQLILYDVLHTPNSVCNIIGLTEKFRSQYPNVSMGGPGKTMGSIMDAHGRSVAYFAPNKSFFQVKLSGPPVGPAVGSSSFTDAKYVINIRWSEDERARWEAYKQKGGNSTDGLTGQDYSSEPARKKAKLHSGQRDAPYTLEEKRWLKVHYGGEFKFLRAYELSIHKDEDREEGRAIMRAFMAEESSDGRKLVDSMLESDDEGDPITGEDEEGDSITGEDEDNLEGHMADYNFDEEALNFMNKHYGNSENFMLSFGLKFYNDDDCEEAKAIARAMMTPD